MSSNNRNRAESISTQLKKRVMIEAMKRTLNNVSASVKYAQISRDTHYRWLKQDSKYRERLDTVNEELLDFAEMQLFKLIALGKQRSIIFFLKTKGKHRGYYTHPKNYNTQINQSKSEFELMTDEELDQYIKDNE